MSRCRCVDVPVPIGKRKASQRVCHCSSSSADSIRLAMALAKLGIAVHHKCLPGPVAYSSTSCLNCQCIVRSIVVLDMNSLVREFASELSSCKNSPSPPRLHRSSFWNACACEYQSNPGQCSTTGGWCSLRIFFGAFLADKKIKRLTLVQTEKRSLDHFPRAFDARAGLRFWQQRVETRMRHPNNRIQTFEI